MKVSQMTTAELERELDQWEDGGVDDAAPDGLRRWDAVEKELEARELYDHEDARVRESVGNYR